MHTGGGPRGFILWLALSSSLLDFISYRGLCGRKSGRLHLLVSPPWSGEKRPYWPHPSLTHARAMRPEQSSKTLKRPPLECNPAKGELQRVSLWPGRD